MPAALVLCYWCGRATPPPPWGPHYCPCGHEAGEARLWCACVQCSAARARLPHGSVKAGPIRQRRRPWERCH